MTVIKINLKNNKQLFVISAYAPGDERKNFVDELSLIFDELELNHLNNYYVLAGDLNARHRS